MDKQKNISLKKIIKILRRINVKTLYINFKFLPFKKALLLPIFISKYCFLLEKTGEIII